MLFDCQLNNVCMRVCNVYVKTTEADNRILHHNSSQKYILLII